MNKKNFYSILFLTLMLTTVSAGGLSVVEDSINITKMFEEDYQAVITIINEEDFTFSSIGFEEEFANIEPLTLEAGKNATVILTIDRNEDFNGQLTLEGKYETNLGASNKTVIIDIDYVNGLSICNLDLIIGDKIQWNNNVLDEIILTSDSDFATILEESNYTKSFNYVEEFDYYAKRNGAKFTEECRINVMDDSGLVHSLQYDYKIDTNIKVNYEPTTIVANFLETQYTVEYNEDKADIFSIKNTGTKGGKHIGLESEWMEFEPNNFDLAVGESKVIKYTISPLIYMTNQTNKTYGLEIKINGNFDEIAQKINVTIPYAYVDSKYSSSVANPEFMHDLYYFFCDLFNDDEICIKTYSSAGKITTIDYTQETITGLLNAESKRQDEQTTYQKTQLEINQNTIMQLNDSNIMLEEMLKEMMVSNEGDKKLTSALYFIIIFVLFALSAFIGYTYFNKDIRRDNIRNKAKFEKEEFTW